MRCAPALKPCILALFKRPFVRYLFNMSTVSEIEAVIPKLSRIEVEELRAWIENYLEDQLELTDEVKARLDQSRREIAAGQYTTRQPE
jgi:ABC-type phosphate transport system ATPase subunit